MEEFDIIETPENVDLQRRLAGIGSRLLAGLLDSLLIAGLLLLLPLLLLALLLLAFDMAVFGFGARVVEQANAWMIAVLILVAFVIYWGYFLLFEMWLNGQTPGKRYMKIRVVQQEGRAVTFDALAVRNLLRAVDGLGFYAVAGIAMFLTKRVQRLGDLAAGTVVISEEIPDYAAKADKKERVLDNVPATAAVLAATRLTPQEYRLLRNYWLRRHQLSAEARERLLPELLRPILERTGTPLPGNSLAVLERHVEELMKQAQTAETGRAGPEEPSEEKR